MPVQLGSPAWPCRYSSATRPTAAALTRSGMSLVTSVTSRPSAASAERHGQDPGVVGVGPEADRQHRLVGVVQLHPQRAALVVDGQRLVQPAVLDPQVVQDPQRVAGEPAELGVVPLALQLGDHHQRQDHLVLGETQDRPRVGQQHRGVDHIGTYGPRGRCGLLAGTGGTGFRGPDWWLGHCAAVERRMAGGGSGSGLGARGGGACFWGGLGGGLGGLGAAGERDEGWRSRSGWSQAAPATAHPGGRGSQTTDARYGAGCGPVLDRASGSGKPPATPQTLTARMPARPEI